MGKRKYIYFKDQQGRLVRRYLIGCNFFVYDFWNRQRNKWCVWYGVTGHLRAISDKEVFVEML